MGGVDILVNNAGTVTSKSHRDPEDPDAYVNLLWYNTLSAAAAMTAAEEYLIASKVSASSPRI